MLYLALVRHLRDLTQAELAQASGVGKYIITRVESGRVNPTPLELQKLAAALDVDQPEKLLQHVSDPLRSDLNQRLLADETDCPRQ